jgi:glycosyltransferase involved in cell wall biosynthesis
MKLLIVVSSLDLTQPFSATPAWWMLLKGLYELGVELIVAPYQGPAIESLWWRAAGNPAKWQGDVFKLARDTARRITPPKPKPAPATTPSRTHVARSGGGEGAGVNESSSELLTRRIAQTLVAPLWARHLDRLLTREKDVDAVIFLTVPLNHLQGVAGQLHRKHHVPVIYYDGDVPASLPTLRGFDSGFRIYQGADLSEYAAFISNSTGGAEMLKNMGARDVHTVWYAADPDVYAPLNVPAQDIDVLFYGHGAEYRAEWIQAMIADANRALPEAHFAVRGTQLDDIGRAAKLPYLSFSKLREYACRSKINLAITRGAHASVYGSSSMRPFELAALGCCIVANPVQGVELWFEPGKEITVVQSGEEALERYRFLLANDAERHKLGQAARARVLKQHTFRHRAQEVVDIVKQYV